MGTTPKLALRYPENTDEPNAPLQFRNLADDVEKFLAAVGPTTGSAWTNYNIAFTGPNLGAGGSKNGYWTRLGRIIIGRFSCTVGTSGFSAGSGLYAWSLPVAMLVPDIPAENYMVGNGVVWRGTGFGELRNGAMMYNSATTMRMIIDDNPYTVQANQPFTMVAGSAWHGTFLYEAAS